LTFFAISCGHRDQVAQKLPDFRPLAEEVPYFEVFSGSCSGIPESLASRLIPNG
jgi:hypothetical protein